MRRAAALAVAGLLCAGAARASSFVFETDPRVELLGAVQSLAGARDPRAPLPAAYGRALEMCFGRFRGHDAVRQYRALADKYQDFGVDALFLTPPPELKPADPAALPPFGGGAADLEEFLGALRRFAADSDFAAFYAAQAGTYRAFEESARAEAGARDFPRLVEDYVGRGLDSRVHYVLAASFAPRRGVSYIIPYPDPERGAGMKGTLDVYVLLAPEGAPAKPSFVGAYRGMLLDEPIYVFVERTFQPFMKANDRDALKDALVRAIGLRLRAAACAGAACGGKRGKKEDAETALLAARLAEYEAARDRYPSLDLFYPRLFAPADSARSASPSETVPNPKTVSGGHGTPEARSQ